MPLSVFRSWEPDDYDAALAWQMHQNEVCPGCGTIDEEWRDPKTKRFLDIPPYEVVPHECAGCVVVDQAVEEAKENKTPTSGLHFRLHRVDPLDYLADE